MKNASEKQELSQAERDTMRRDLERLMESVSRNALLPPADVEEIRRKVFGYSTFFVTATELSAEYPGGVLFRGNKARGLRVADAHAAVTAGVQALFGDKYLVVCMEEPPDPAAFFNGDSAVDSSPPPPVTPAAGAASPTAGAGPAVEEPQRVSFVLVPSELAQPTPTAGWQYALALVLSLFTFGACAELGLEAQLAQLPRETLEFFAQPGAFEALPEGAAIPGLDSLNIGALFASAAPITTGVLSCAAAHELGHALAARLHNVKLSPPYLIPNGSLGTFGAVTQIKSVLKTRTQLFDVAFAGLAAGGAASALLFLAGLVASSAGAHDLPLADGPAAVRAAALAAGLVPVPATLFQGSLLLGGLSTLALHPAGAEVFVHPAFVAGWCGLTATALNALPIGSLDGGRIAMAAYGKRQLTPLSFGSYLGLALGLLGGALSLPFGLYALIVQRVPERQPLDAVSPPQGGWRRNAATGALLTALATLLPLSLSLPAGTGM
jgi:membrane-associated protease RseP (regulator of RpoE activity)